MGTPCSQPLVVFQTLVFLWYRLWYHSCSNEQISNFGIDEPGIYPKTHHSGASSRPESHLVNQCGSPEGTGVAGGNRALHIEFSLGWSAAQMRRSIPVFNHPTPKVVHYQQHQQRLTVPTSALIWHLLLHRTS